MLKSLSSLVQQLVLIIVLTMLSFNATSQVEVQGHRGWRGMYPENTIEGFIQAMNLGVDVLEMDVVLSSDGHPIVSHEPWFNPSICKGPEGKLLPKKKRINLYQLTLEEIQRYDCGSNGSRLFPDQQSVIATKPSLRETLTATEDWVKQHPGLTIGYNIEIKRQKRWENKYCPPVPAYCEAVLAVIREADIAPRCLIQSFDVDVLEYLHKYAPEFPLAYLVEKGSLKGNLKKLSFLPAVYSPHFKKLRAEDVKRAHALSMQVIPWTVNDPADIKFLIDIGVNGIISDYPERVLYFLNRL